MNICMSIIGWACFLQVSTAQSILLYRVFYPSFWEAEMFAMLAIIIQHRLLTVGKNTHGGDRESVESWDVCWIFIMKLCYPCLSFNCCTNNTVVVTLVQMSPSYHL